MSYSPKFLSIITSIYRYESRNSTKALKYLICCLFLFSPIIFQAQDLNPLKPIPITTEEKGNSVNKSDFTFDEISMGSLKSGENPESLLVDEQCGTVPVAEMMRQKYGGPTIEQFEKWMQTEKLNLRNTINTRAVITIPVVVHVIHNGEAVGGLPNISDAQIQSQIDVLNEDFRRMNSDASNTPMDFLPAASDVEIEFCLATVDPDGMPSTGITRYNGGRVSYSISDLENNIKPNTIWHPDYYFNIWCAPLQGGLLGYAQFPSMSMLPGLNFNGGPAFTDGIVVRDYTFGRGGSAIAGRDLGRIATHEAGHFFGLRHIGGDGDCSADDFCADTPTQDGQTYTNTPCSYPGTNGCTDAPVDFPDQFMNYMDYSYGVCMNLFTNDQKARMDVVMANSPRRASLANSMVCQGTPPPVAFNPFPNAPANDLCINAETIDCSEVITGNISDASPYDIPATCGTTPGGPGVWFKFTGDGNLAVLSLCNSNFNTKINVYDGSCGALTCIVGDDNSCGLQSFVNFSAVLGTDYFIYISGFDGETGNFELERSCVRTLGTASNIYSSVRVQQNQVYADDATDLITFIHRQDINIFGGGEAENGKLRYDISTDGGATFTNNIGVLNNTYSKPARYPQLTGTNLTNSADPLDQNLIWHAPTIVGGSWEEHVTGFSDVTTTFATSTENYVCATDSVYLPGGLCEGLPGEFWAADMSLTHPSDLGDSLFILKGTYNGGTTDVDWSKQKVIYPNHFTGFDGMKRIIAPNISFSPDGNTGWTAFLGDLAGGLDTVFNPVFIPSFNGGETWGEPIEVNLDLVDFRSTTLCGSTSIKELLQEGNNFSTGKPTCAFDFDITVDINGNPHMFVVVGSASTSASPMAAYSIFSALPMVALDIFSEDGGDTWNAIQVSPITNLRSTIGSVNTLSMDNFPQISRTPDGSHIFYSWMDKILNTNNQSVPPNLRIAAQRISDGFVTCPKSITAGTIYDGVAFFPTMAPEVLINPSGMGYNLPIVTVQLNTSGNPLSLVRYLYMGNEATIDESEFLFNYASVDHNACENFESDEYGYTAFDCNDCNGPTYDWIDITTKPGAMQTVGLTDDNSIGPFPIGFDFTYYWNDYSQLKIGSNGWIGFNNTSNIAHCFEQIPTPGGVADNFLAPFLSDLNLAGAGNPGRVWYWSNQVDTMIISYIDVPFWSGSAPGYTGMNTFQVILAAQDNSITYQYLSTTPHVDTPGCLTEIQIGMENVTGDIGYLVHQETRPDDQCAIKFYYPDEVVYEIFDATPDWNQNNKNLVEIFDIGETQDLTSQISNVGNKDLADVTTFAELINLTTSTSLFTASGSIPSLNVGESVLHTFVPPFKFVEIGNYSFTSEVEHPDDFNASNDIVTSEILVINCLEEVVKLDYNTSDAFDGGISWTGTDDRDNYGAAVFFDPPGDSFRLDSVELMVFKDTPISDQTITVKVIANDGPLGQGTVLFETDLLETQYPDSEPFSVSVGGIEVGEDGFFVYWGGDESTFILTSSTGPFSNAGFEILDGMWSEYRANNTTEMHIRAIGQCPVEPDITLTKTDEFFDVNGNGLLDFGEIIRYTVVATNAAGGGNAGEVMFYSPVDPITKLKIGSVMTSQGSVTIGNTPGDSEVNVDLGTLFKGTSAIITFDVEKSNGEEGFVVSCQGTLSGSNFENILSDDPDKDGEMDPTITVIPTLSQWGLISLLLIMLVFGLVVMKQKQIEWT